MEAETKTASDAAVAAHETHALAQRKVEQMSKIGAALGLRDAVEGEAFDQELQAKRKEEKMRAREEALKAKLAQEEEEEERKERCVRFDTWMLAR